MSAQPRVFGTTSEEKCKEDASEHPHIIVEVTKDFLVEAMPSEMEEEKKISVKSEAGSREGGNDESLLPDPIQSAQEPIPAWATTTTRAGRLVGRKDGQYNPTTGKTVSFAMIATCEAIMNNYYAALANIFYEEGKTTKELTGTSVSISELVLVEDLKIQTNLSR